MQLQFKGRLLYYMLSLEEKKLFAKLLEEDISCRDVKSVLQDYVLTKFESKNLIRTYGDFYYKVKTLSADICEGWYICRHITWGLCLSETYYEIHRFAELDSDGEFAHDDFEIRALTDEEAEKYKTMDC